MKRAKQIGFNFELPKFIYMKSIETKIMESRYQRNGSLPNGILKEMAMSPQKRSGPIYTMGGRGAHVLMNSQSIMTATAVQFVQPGRPKCTMVVKKLGPKSSFVEPLFFNPILNTLRGLFSMLFWPMIRPQANDIETKMPSKTEPNLVNAEAQLNSNIYMNLVPDLTELSFCDYDEFADDRLDSPIDLKLFDFMPKDKLCVDEMGKGVVGVDVTTVAAAKKAKCELNTKIVADDQVSSIDTTDFICTFAMVPQEPAPFDELKMSIVTAVMEKEESRPQDVHLEELPPAEGQRNGITVEDAIEETSLMQKTSDSNHTNVMKCHRRAANKINGYRRGNNYNSKRASKKATYSAKNRCSKSRHQLALNIQDDLDDMHWMVDDNDDDEHMIQDEWPVIASSITAMETMVAQPEVFASTSTQPNAIEAVRPGCMFSHFFSIGGSPTKQQQRQFQRPWPMIAVTHRPLVKMYFDSPLPTRRCKRTSESECDDSFILFAEDSPRTVPSMDALLLQQAPSNTTLGIMLPNCFGHMAVNNININNVNATRQRKWSESSDDFICFESDEGDCVDYDDDDDVYEDDSESDFDSDEETANETDSDDGSDIDDEHLSIGTNLPDSGIEEKRVNI